MPSAYSVPMASHVLPDPDTPTTATVRHSGTSTSISSRLLCRAPRTAITVGRGSRHAETVPCHLGHHTGIPGAVLDPPAQGTVGDLLPPGPDDGAGDVQQGRAVRAA